MLDEMRQDHSARTRSRRLPLESKQRWVRPGTKLLAKFTLVVGASVLLGGLTSPAQRWLPYQLSSFANSASGWTLLTALIVFSCRERVVVSAIMGSLSFLGLVVGYQVVSSLRGHADSEDLFTVAAIVVGPAVGASACWIRGRGVTAATGCGVLAGIGIGDAAIGLTINAATTGHVYWILIGAAGLALVATMTIRRLLTARVRLLTLVLTLAVAGTFYIVFTTG